MDDGRAGMDHPPRRRGAVNHHAHTGMERPNGYMPMTVYVVVQRAGCEGARYVQPIIYYKYDDEMLVPENNDFNDDNGRDAVGGVNMFVTDSSVGNL